MNIIFIHPHSTKIEEIVADVKHGKEYLRTKGGVTIDKGELILYPESKSGTSDFKTIASFLSFYNSLDQEKRSNTVLYFCGEFMKDNYCMSILSICRLYGLRVAAEPVAIKKGIEES